ncbi:MAG TPA: hypothetical protein VFT29_04590 [Gemmatimonadaceae bacterium]|nr:hypothetical protein [Gemmatimonadaceae bacterium]
MNRNFAPAPDRLTFAAALVGLGVLSLVYGDFALQWQPVPAWVPGRTALAYLSGVVLLCMAAGLAWQRTAAAASRVLFAYVLLWFVLLEVPKIAREPLVEGNWSGAGEIAAILAGGWILFQTLGQGRGSTRGFFAGERGKRVATLLLALGVIPIGIAHFVYAPQTIGFVPKWIPFRPFWAYLGGAGHIAAGLGILLGVVPRLAATMEAGMIAVFTALVWVPLVVASPKSQLPWTGLFVSWIVGAAAWVVAASMRSSASKVHPDLAGLPRPTAMDGSPAQASASVMPERGQPTH